jgi:Domain of unknown function (DUF4412)
MPDDSFKKFMPGPLSALPELHARLNKSVFVFTALAASLIAARADLVMEQRSSSANDTNHITLKVHDDKMRMDQRDSDGYVFSVIIDLNTRDSITLFPRGKAFLKRSGTEIRQQMEAEAKASHGTNEMDNPPAKAGDTGKGEKVNGYEAEIYTWSGAGGLTETLWVATNFPGYESIRTELTKIDRFDASGPHKNAQPQTSLLPGMVVKEQKVIKGRTATITLISAKAEPVDASLFEMPADYSPWKPPEMRLTIPAMTQTNDEPPPSP